LRLSICDFQGLTIPKLRLRLAGLQLIIDYLDEIAALLVVMILTVWWG
jgi:hypothetical protein